MKHYRYDKDLNLYLHTNKYKDNEEQYYRVSDLSIPKITYNGIVYTNIDDIPNKKQFMKDIKTKNGNLSQTEQLRIEQEKIEDVQWYVREIIKYYNYKIIDAFFVKNKDLQVLGVDVIVLAENFNNELFFMCFDAKTTIEYDFRCNLFFELYQNCQDDIWQLGSALTQGICKHHYLIFPDDHNCYLFAKDTHNIEIMQYAATQIDHKFYNDKNVTHQTRSDKYCVIVGEETNKKVFEQLHRIHFKKNTSYADKNKKYYKLIKTFDNINFIDDRLEKIVKKVKRLIDKTKVSRKVTERELTYIFLFDDILENEDMYFQKYSEDHKEEREAILDMTDEEIGNIQEYVGVNDLAVYFYTELQKQIPS